jgi:hypothetical protein
LLFDDRNSVSAKTEMEVVGMKASKSICPKDLGVSGKIVFVDGKNFCRNPKIFF